MSANVSTDHPHVAPIADRITVTITAAVAIHACRRSIVVLQSVEVTLGNIVQRLLRIERIVLPEPEEPGQ